MRYLLEGRVIPERVDANVPKMGFTVARLSGEPDINLSVIVIRSKIFVYVRSDIDEHFEDLRNLVSTLLSKIFNYIGFMAVQCYSFEIESITDVKIGETQVLGINGLIFDTASEWDGLCSFRRMKEGDRFNLDKQFIENEALSRATMELRNSIRYHDFTALHCRLAIEAIRNGFDDTSEDRGWRELRRRLKIKRKTIESFQVAAGLQRHGRNTPQTWKQRQSAMQIAWEVVNRYYKLVSTGVDTVDLPEM